MCGYHGPIYMTHPTKAICPILLEDFSKISAQLGSKTVHSLLSSMTDGLYLPSDLLKESLVMLLVAIISQLLVLSGDIETNPGPIACECCSSHLTDLV